MKTIKWILGTNVLAVAVVSLVGCGGSGSTPPPLPPQTRELREYQRGDNWTYAMGGVFRIGERQMTAAGNYRQEVMEVRTDGRSKLVTIAHKLRGTIGTNEIDEEYSETYRQNPDRSLTPVSGRNYHTPQIPRHVTQTSFSIPGTWRVGETQGTIQYNVGAPERAKLEVTRENEASTPFGRYRTWQFTQIYGSEQDPDNSRAEFTHGDFVPALGNFVQAMVIRTFFLNGQSQRGSGVVFTLTSTNVPLPR